MCFLSRLDGSADDQSVRAEHKPRLTGGRAGTTFSDVSKTEGETFRLRRRHAPGMRQERGTFLETGPNGTGANRSPIVLTVGSQA